MDRPCETRSIRGRLSPLGLVAALFILACQTNLQFLTTRRTRAVDTALTEAYFEMDCPGEKGLLCPEVVRSALQGSAVAGIERAEFTIGVTGCGQRRTYMVACPEGDESCFALDSATGRPR